jgi:hypothetical protein
VQAPVQYGPNVAAIVIYLYAGQFLSKGRTARALAELFGTPVSAGTVAAMAARAAAVLNAGGGFTDQVREKIVGAQVDHRQRPGRGQPALSTPVSWTISPPTTVRTAVIRLMASSGTVK